MQESTAYAAVTLDLGRKPDNVRALSAFEFLFGGIGFLADSLGRGAVIGLRGVGRIGNDRIVCVRFLDQAFVIALGLLLPGIDFRDALI